MAHKPGMAGLQAGTGQKTKSLLPIYPTATAKEPVASQQAAETKASPRLLLQQTPAAPLARRWQQWQQPQ